MRTQRGPVTDVAVKVLGLLPLTVFALAMGRLAAFYPESFLGSALALLWGWVILRALRRIGQRSLGDPWLVKAALAGLCARVPIVIAHVAIGFLILGGLVDFPGYVAHSRDLAGALLSGDIQFFSLPYFSLDPGLGFNIVSRLLTFGSFFFGPTLVGLFFLSGVIGFFGGYLFLRAFQTEFPHSRQARFLAVCLFFFPSVAFWSSLLGKDSWMFLFLGWATYAFANLLTAVRLRDVFGLLVSVVFVLLIRPPIGIALAVVIGGSLTFAVLSRLPVRGPAAVLRPAAYIFCGLFLIGTLTAAKSLALQHVRHYLSISPDASWAEGLLSLGVYKHVGFSTERASLEVQITQPGLVEGLQFLPVGMFTFLFRPFIFEAHNLLALVAALDSTLLLFVVLWRWKHLLTAVRFAFNRPFLLFCAPVFFLLTAALAFESNFGAIVRHRTMVLPFLFILLSVPRSKKDAGSGPMG